MFLALLISGDFFILCTCMFENSWDAARGSVYEKMVQGTHVRYALASFPRPRNDQHIFWCH